MTTAQKLARFGATAALALTLVAATAPSFAYADDEDQNHDESRDAPLVLNIVNGSVQNGASATQFGLGVGEAYSGEEGLGTAVQGTGVGAAVTGAGLGIPAGVLGR
jgi:hypothetical protein